VTAWQLDAACANRFDLFDAAADGYPQAIAAAKDVCSACPYTALCLTRALEARDAWTIAGGLTPDERAGMATRAGFLQPSIKGDVHNRSRYVSGDCKCDRCRAANAAYVRTWRAMGRVTRRVVVVAVRELPNGQLMWEMTG
jgi:hypothetical protein